MLIHFQAIVKIIMKYVDPFILITNLPIIHKTQYKLIKGKLGCYYPYYSFNYFKFD